MKNIMNLARDTDDFITAYIEAALWSSVDDDGQPLDQNYNWTHLAPKALEKMVDDCVAFQKRNADLLKLCGDTKQNGHDLWLTRNHHGAGYWDRDYSETVADQITERAHAMGSQDLYVGDDGKIYL